MSAMNDLDLNLKEADNLVDQAKEVISIHPLIAIKQSR